MSKQIHTKPSYEDFLQNIGDMKNMMAAIAGDKTAHEILHEISDERRQHIICSLTGAFKMLIRHKRWFRRYLENWRTVYEEKTDFEMRQIYARFLEGA